MSAEPPTPPVPVPPLPPEKPTLEGRSVDEMSFVLSSRRTRLSFQRTRMSADRTLMSIIRTALSLIGFGFTLFQFFRYLRSEGTAVATQAARNFGVALVSLGILLLIFGIMGHVSFMRDLRKEHRDLVQEDLIPHDYLPYSVTLGAALLLLLVGLLAITSMVVRVGPFH